MVNAQHEIEIDDRLLKVDPKNAGAERNREKRGRSGFRIARGEELVRAETGYVPGAEDEGDVDSDVCVGIGEDATGDRAVRCRAGSVGQPVLEKMSAASAIGNAGVLRSTGGSSRPVNSRLKK
jgi:hypothetical protein